MKELEKLLNEITEKKKEAVQKRKYVTAKLDAEVTMLTNFESMIKNSIGISEANVTASVSEPE